MKTFISLLFIFSILSWHKSAYSFCVQTFNTYGPLYGIQLKKRTQLLIESLSSKDTPCDILHFQEVWKKNHKKHLLNSLDHNRSPYQGYDFDLLREDGLKTGLMSFYTYPIHESGSLLYHYNRSNLIDSFREDFGIHKALSFTLNHQHQIIALNTHLHPTSQNIRLMQLIEILRWMEQNPEWFLNYSQFLTGDFNFAPHSLEWQFMVLVLSFRDSFFDIHRSYEGFCTYCKKNPLAWDQKNRVIDFIFYSSFNPLVDVEVQKSQIIYNQETPLSDHYGVETHFELNTRSFHHLVPEDFKTKTCASALSAAKHILTIISHELPSNNKEIQQQINLWKSNLIDTSSFLSKRICLISEYRLHEDFNGHHKKNHF